MGRDLVSCPAADRRKMKPRADLRDPRGVLGALAIRQRTNGLGSGILNSHRSCGTSATGNSSLLVRLRRGAVRPKESPALAAGF